ncbi:MAG: DNA polymerase III subunit chi [Burkholderiaceae bacterium]|jgi:DNA polymerase-3 subunit chi
MTQVDFHVNTLDKLLHACKVVRKAYQAGKKVVCYSRDGALLSQFDKALWSFSALDFLPHVPAGHALAVDTPIILASAPDAALPHEEVLINLDHDWPPFFARFERLIELVGLDESDKAAGRDRYKFYRDRGYPLHLHDLGKS